ncbi:hypothetical protein ACPCUX_05575 [Cellulosimicrobium sp. AB352]|uniref:hypothetical protein n=1 Tax=Cellulosimicrobium sp. AB352 TaxID=3413281 RepID=UPI003C21AE0A
MTIEAPEPAGPANQLIEAAVRAGLSAIPLAGGAAVELFQAVVTRGREQRFQSWVVDLTDAVNRLLLEPRGATFEDLSNDEAFMDVIGEATRAAVETSDEVKIDALRNAVLNSAFQPDTGADRRAILLDMLVGLTPTHIKLLKLYDDPRAWYSDAGVPVPDIMMGGAGIVVKDAYPDLAADKALLDYVVKDLGSKNLARIDLGLSTTADSVFGSKTQQLGKELIAFITEPEASQGHPGGDQQSA